MNTLNEHQFGPWKMTPTMKRVFGHMQERHLGEENRGETNHIAEALGGYVSRAKHDHLWEAMHRLKDNGLIKIDSHTSTDDYDTSIGEYAWIPND
jgi:hypothetical protein